MSTFRSFSTLHLEAVLGVGAFVALFVLTGRAWRGTRRQRALEVTVGMVILAVRVGVFAWNVAPSHASIDSSLPLQICDLAAIAAGLALIRHNRFLASIAYFWGLSLSIQGIIQPDLSSGPASLEFWLFWMHHAAIVGTAAYLIAVRGFEPTGRDFRSAIVAGWIYVAVIFCFDFAFNVNYGYLGQGMPSQPTLLDWLGPWPWRVLVIGALGTGAMWLLVLPWTAERAVVRRRKAVRAADGETSPPAPGWHG